MQRATIGFASLASLPQIIFNLVGYGAYDPSSQVARYITSDGLGPFCFFSFNPYISEAIEATEAMRGFSASALPLMCLTSRSTMRQCHAPPTPPVSCWEIPADKRTAIPPSSDLIVL